MEKNIVLIGGSTGIGKELALNLAEDHKVFILSRTKPEFSEQNTEYLQFDATKDNIEDLDLPNSIHGLVYCPGSIDLKPFKMLKLEGFEKDMHLNFFSLVKVVKGLMPKLKKADQASLVFFSTVAVKVGMPFHTSIAAAKAAIEGFAKSLAAEYAPSLRVNVIAPSLTNTPLAKNLLSTDEKKKKMDDRHPLKRVGTPKDIASLAVFLINDKSSWITGQVIGVDGGLSTINMN